MRYIFSRLLDWAAHYDCLLPLIERVPEHWCDQADSGYSIQ